MKSSTYFLFFIFIFCHGFIVYAFNEDFKDGDRSTLSKECGVALVNLFRTAKLDKKIQREYEPVPISLQKGIILFKNTRKKEKPFDPETPGANSPMGWFELDLNQSELRDISVDPENPRQLSFNKSTLKPVMKFCATSVNQPVRRSLENGG
jgi:hypothetical protein